MTIKVFAALVAAVLFVGYVAPMLFKMKDFALTGVVVLGIGAMLADLWYTLRNPGD